MLFLEDIATGYRIALRRALGLDAHPVPPSDPGTKEDGGSDDLMGVERLKAFAEYFRTEQDRRRLYDEYDQMDEGDAIGGILDMYAEDAATPNPDTGRIVWFESHNKRIKEVLNNMAERLHLESNAVPIIRDMCKYGDAWRRLICATSAGIQAIRFVKPHSMVRCEDRLGRLVGFKQDGQKFLSYPVPEQAPTKEVMSNPWDFVQFSLQGKTHGIPNYGTSALYHARRPWRQILIAEDSSLLYKIQRAPDRLLWKIDIGKADESEGSRILNAFRKRWRKQTLLDPAQQRMDQQYKALTPSEDIFLGVREGSVTDVSVLSGSGNVDDMNDLRYFQTKMHNALRVPMAYRGYEDPQNADIRKGQKLSSQSMLYARAVRRMQQCFIAGVRTLCHIELTLLNPQNENPDLDWRVEGNAFHIVMEPVSYLEEVDRLDAATTRVNLAQILSGFGREIEGLNLRKWTQYIMHEIMRLPPALIASVLQSVPTQPAPEGGPQEEGPALALTRLFNNEPLSTNDLSTLNMLMEQNPDAFKRLRVIAQDAAALELVPTESLGELSKVTLIEDQSENTSEDPAEED